MSSISALLHSRDLPGAGVPCVVRFVGDVLVVEGPEQFEVPAESLELSAGGFHDDTLFVNWARVNVQYSLVITDRTAQQALAESAPPGLKAVFRQRRGELRYHRSKWTVVLMVLGAIGAGLLLSWWQSEAIIAWLAGKVPLAREERLGAMGLEQLRIQEMLTQEGVAAETVATIGSRLTAGSRYRYQWFLNDDASINAFALPGGIVVVNSGLIVATDTPEELAGVLAHEVQHVEGHHALEQMIHSAGWAAILAVTLGDVSTLGGVLIHQAGNLRYSRQLELEADSMGVRNLARVGIAPQGVAQFFARIESEQARSGGGSVIALLSSHPATADRLQQAAELAAATPCECQPLKFDWKAIRESLQDSSVEAPSQK